MLWGPDDVVDQLIANNAARLIPGMEKPDMSKFRMPGRIDREKPVEGKRHTPADRYVIAVPQFDAPEV